MNWIFEKNVLWGIIIVVSHHCQISQIQMWFTARENVASDLRILYDFSWALQFPLPFYFCQLGFIQPLRKKKKKSHLFPYIYCGPPKSRLFEISTYRFLYCGRLSLAFIIKYLELALRNPGTYFIFVIIRFFLLLAFLAQRQSVFLWDAFLHPRTAASFH